MKKNYSRALLVALLLVGMSAFFVASAQLTGPSNPGGLPDWSGGAGAAGLIRRIILVILSVSAIIAVLFIIIGGFQYILSGANEDLAKRGKTTITNAIIGLIIIILSYTVIQVVYTTLIRPPS